MNSVNGIEVLWLTSSRCNAVARLHSEGIATGFISSLGLPFVTALYEVIAEDKNSFALIAVENDQVLGFVAFSANLSRLYKYVALKKGPHFALLLAGKLLSWRAIKKIWDNLWYPSKMKKMDLPSAELLSIAVAPEGRGKGVAAQLIAAGFSECRRRGIDRVKVLVAAANEPANKLYQKCGFKQVCQISSHGVLSNIYVIALASDGIANS